MFPKKKTSKQNHLPPPKTPSVTNTTLSEDDFIMPSVVNWTGHSLISDPPPKTPSPTILSPTRFPTTPDTSYPQTPSPMPAIPKTPSIDYPPPFTKSNKRTREENTDQSTSKIPRMGIMPPPVYFSATASKISLDDITSPVLDQTWEDIDDIINKPSPSKPVDLNDLDSYANLAPIQDQDWADIESFIQPIPNPQNILENTLAKAPPPPPSLSDMMFSNPPTLDDVIFPDSEPPPIPSSSSTFIYKTVFTGRELVDLSLVPLIIPPSDNIYPSASKNPPSPPPPHPPPILSPEELAALNASAASTEMSSASLLESLKPRHKSKKGEKSSKKTTTTTNYPEDTTTNLTSSQLFNLLVYLSNCARDRLFLDKNIFLNIPNIGNLLDAYNKTILSMKDYNPTNYQTITTSHMKTSYRNIGTFLKQTYISIYPAKEILELIESNDESLNCIWILEHEEGLRDQLQKIKYKVSNFKSKSATRIKTVEKRVAEMVGLIAIVKIEFKKIYNLE
ncbi:MAG: hypothetical protein KFW09_04775 [Oscillospiraceae bacterium]|nr:hypothetical protein [Oscillospiraceae bacterium]